MFKDVVINFWAVMLAAFISILIRMGWYSNKIFGKHKNKIEEEHKEKSELNYIFIFLSTIVMAYILSFIIYIMRPDGASEGAEIGFYVWLGFIATSTLNSVVSEKKSKVLYLIDNGYYLVSLVIMGIILGVW